MAMEVTVFGWIQLQPLLKILFLHRYVVPESSNITVATCEEVQVFLDKKIRKNQLQV
jgi:hypothetical protein